MRTYCHIAFDEIIGPAERTFVPLYDEWSDAPDDADSRWYNLSGGRRPARIVFRPGDGSIRELVYDDMRAVLGALGVDAAARGAERDVVIATELAAQLARFRVDIDGGYVSMASVVQVPPRGMTRGDFAADLERSGMDRRVARAALLRLDHTTTVWREDAVVLAACAIAEGERDRKAEEELLKQVRYAAEPFEREEWAEKKVSKLLATLRGDAELFEEL